MNFQSCLLFILSTLSTTLCCDPMYGGAPKSVVDSRALSRALYYYKSSCCLFADVELYGIMPENSIDSFCIPILGSLLSTVLEDLLATIVMLLFG